MRRFFFDIPEYRLSAANVFPAIFFIVVFSAVCPPVFTEEGLSADVGTEIKNETASGSSSGTVHSSDAALLRFIHRPGEVLHADARVMESVYADGLYYHDAEITESSVSVTKFVDEDGTASLESVFRTEERIAGAPWYVEWVSEEKVLITRDVRGRLEIPENAARPVFRDIPVFPDDPVAPGDSWNQKAAEVHLFRFGDVLAGPYRADFNAVYTYLERIESEGRDLARIRIEYDIHLPVREPGEPIRMLSGRSVHHLLWDIENGIPVSRVEDFEFFLLLSDGYSREFRGRQEIEYRRIPVLERERVADDFRKEFAEIPGMDVEVIGEGVRLILDDAQNIYFDPESAEISKSARAYLEILGNRLADYADRDILITGHTAHYGSAEGRRDLSRRRAAAAAEALFPAGRSGSGKLYIRGVGSEIPTGTDAKDRRVEILILD